MHIVVVEDHLSLAKGIAYQLRDEGHAVDLLHDGDDAAAFLPDSGADLVVLDINPLAGPESRCYAVFAPPATIGPSCF